MSGFQRFVTYINLYEENNKIRNVGFAKIEKRSGQCRMEVHMRGTGYTNVSCPIYLFVRRENRLLGIPLGKIQMQNGNGDFRLAMDGDNICQSGYNIDQAGGVLIFVTEKIMFASQWDDIEIQRSQFRILEKKPESIKSRESEVQPKKTPQDIKKSVPVKEPPLEAKDIKETVSVQKKNLKDSPDKHKINSETVKVDRGPELLSFEKKAVVKEDIKAAEAAPVLEEPILEPLRQYQPVQERAEQPMQQPPIQEKSVEEKPVESSWNQKWKFILENYPVITPFEEETDIQCVRIELKDLRLLPKRYWYLGNNSFLLHGFFNYRYLILGAVYSEETVRWFIGVPGVFQSQEKVMASIFGFPEYKSEKKADHKTGQFGYWYRFMDE